MARVVYQGRTIKAAGGSSISYTPSKRGDVIMLFDDISNAKGRYPYNSQLMNDQYDLDDWNIVYELYEEEDKFTDIIVEGNQITLKNGQNVNMNELIFGTNTHLLEFTDTGCLTSLKGSFFNCSNLTKVTLGRNITEFKSGAIAFGNATSLASFVIPENLEHIPGNSFNNCTSLEGFEVSPKNPYYSEIDGVLTSKDLKTLCIYPHGKIGVSYEIPDSIETIRMWAFHRTYSLEELYLGENVKTIEADAIHHLNNLLQFHYNEKLETIGGSMVFSTKLGQGEDTLIIPNSVRYLGQSALCNYFHIKTLHLGYNIEYIGSTLLNYAQNLEEIYIKTSIAPITGNIPDGHYHPFYGDVAKNVPGRTITIHIPIGSQGYDAAPWINDERISVNLNVVADIPLELGDPIYPNQPPPLKPKP